MIALLLASAALAEEPLHIRLSPGVGWLQGTHVGRPDDPRVTVRGLALRQDVFLGGAWDHGAVGMSVGAHGAPWLQVATPDASYGALPNATFAFGVTYHLRPGDGPWHGVSNLGTRLPFRLVGREHRAVVESFYGVAFALGVGRQSAPGPKRWSTSTELVVEGMQLLSAGRSNGLGHNPKLRVLVPTVRVTAAFGGWR